MEKVVLDTNIYISAIVIGKTCEEILHRCRQGEFEVCVSPPILEELLNVLGRKFKWTGHQVALVLEDLRSFTTLVNPQEKIGAIREDESDNRILECAVVSGAFYIVTGDRHLLNLGAYRKISILSPAQFLHR